MTEVVAKRRAPRNRTLTLSHADQPSLAARLVRLTGPTTLDAVVQRTIHGDATRVLPFLPSSCVDLVVADPPYNLRKTYDGNTFAIRDLDAYEAWLDLWVSQIARVLKPDGSVYVCAEWRSSTAVHRVLERYFKIRNRISWEREKGRGSSRNWKN